jgi:hypothetical protein
MLYQSLTGAPPEPPRRTAAAPARARAPRPADLVAIACEVRWPPIGSSGIPRRSNLAEDLKRFQTGQLVGAHRYSLPAHVRRFAARHPAITLLGLIGVSAIVVRACAG